MVEEDKAPGAERLSQFAQLTDAEVDAVACQFLNSPYADHDTYSEGRWIGDSRGFFVVATFLAC
ncbi:hypothetical protein [Mycobacterium sp. 852002-51163_SCH5372311]|uniref:hypothetical protein n=1 Tax=Mycobacterium sp. 852002-51163_SCH5372311 TaxID=1834097 RepID=UPI0009EF6ACD|nr:hypothetical protein [Mycobacterium sp. 852002-51163_SCH5372311]